MRECVERDLDARIPVDRRAFTGKALMLSGNVVETSIKLVVGVACIDDPDPEYQMLKLAFEGSDHASERGH